MNSNTSVASTTNAGLIVAAKSELTWGNLAHSGAASTGVTTGSTGIDARG